MPADELLILEPGRLFHARYEVIRCVRRGGMGSVYEVRDVHTTRLRALKVMLPKSVSDPDLRARFAQEATITAGVRSDHIVETFDAGIDEATESPFLVMELLDGKDLSDLLDRGPVRSDEVVRILTQLARALDKTHAAGIVHRDLKPENLFLTTSDDPHPRLKVLDFGVAKLVAPDGLDAKTTRVLGTPLYMSKEQILGEGTIGPPADLYAMAHIAFALLTGRPYWLDEANSSRAPFVFMSKVLAGAPEPATARARRHGVELPSDIDEWFARATHLDAMQRYQRASELLEALESILADAPLNDRVGALASTTAEDRQSTSAPSMVAPSALLARTRKRALRQRIPSLALAALVGGGLVTVVFLASRSENPGESARPASSVIAADSAPVLEVASGSGTSASTAPPRDSVATSTTPEVPPSTSASPNGSATGNVPLASNVGAQKRPVRGAQPPPPSAPPIATNKAPPTSVNDDADPTKVR